MIQKTYPAALAALSALLLAPAPAQAQVAFAQGSPIIASYHARGMCLDVRASDKAVLLWTCHGGGNQSFRFVSGNYGQIRNGDGLCLTGGRNSRSSVTAQPCNPSNNLQRWGFNSSDSTLRNEGGWCADVEGGARNAGARIISYACGSQMNQKWYPAVSVSRIYPGLATFSAVTNARDPKGILSSTGFSGGNLVAAGGGNLVAAGGGNLVAAGGGNLVLGGAGNLVAAGGGNLVAAGGGNVVPTNAGNLMPNNWSFFNNLSAGSLVGNDGASLAK